MCSNIYFLLRVCFLIFLSAIYGKRLTKIVFFGCKKWITTK